MKRKHKYKYAKCKKKKKAVYQVLSPGYIFYTKCLTCGEIITESFEEHFEVFQIEDTYYDGMFDDHLEVLIKNSKPYKIN